MRSGAPVLAGLGAAALPALALLGGVLLTGCASARSPAPAFLAAPDRPRTESRPPNERRLMVTFESASPRDMGPTLAELENAYHLEVVVNWRLSTLGRHCVVVEVPAAQDLAETVRELRTLPRIDVVQPVQSFEVLASSAPNLTAAALPDPYLHLQHGAESIRLHDAHRMATGRDVSVAVIDTGVDHGHPDLEGRVSHRRNFVPGGGASFSADLHGTAVAGVIAATAANGIGIVGVAPDVKILALKACWYEPPGSGTARCNSLTLALAIDYAVERGAQILNLSLTGPPDPILTQLLEKAVAAGVMVVAARDPTGGAAPSFPALLPAVLAVEPMPGEPAAGRAEHRSTRLAAPGADILTTVPGGSFDFLSGASFAAAHVTGIAALLFQHRPDLAPGDVASLLRDTATPAGWPALVDACAALARSLDRADGCPARETAPAVVHLAP